MKHFVSFKKYANVNIILIAASFFAVSSGVLAAWNNPNTSPPNDNVDPPVNVSGDPQKKSGDLNIGGGLDYWITKDGDSFSLKNDAGTDKFIVGQDGNIIVNGQIKITGGTPGLNKLLVSDAAGLASWKTAADAGITGSLPAGMLGQTLRHDGFSWIANSVIFNNGTDVGIGTNAPAAKLDINGQIMIRGGLPGAGKVLVSDANGLASWEAPSAGVIASSCSAGSVVTGIDSGGNLVCGRQIISGACAGNKFVKGIDGAGNIICDDLPPICAASTCTSLGYNCGNWPDGCGNTISCGNCVSPQICASGVCATSCTPKTCAQQGFACGSQTDGCGNAINCGNCASGQTCVSGTCKDEDCKGNNLGGKRIFVTSAGYSGSQVRNDSAADTLCQTHATTAGLPGTYKALIYLGSRLPETALPLGYAFYNGQYTGSYCDWKLVAGSRALMWSLPLANPIRYDEFGNSSVLTSVWTNFKSDGSGTYQVVQQCTAGFVDDCCPDGYCWPCKHAMLKTGPFVFNANPCARAYYGNPTETGVNWSGIYYNVTGGLTANQFCGQALAVWNTCQAFQRALYCVEQ